MSTKAGQIQGGGQGWSETDVFIQKDHAGQEWKDLPSNGLKWLKKNYVVLIWVVLAIIGGVAQAVTLKLSGDAIPNLQYFLFWITVIPFVIYFVLFLGAVAVFSDEITPEMRKIPQWKFMIIGFLTTLNGIFMLFPNPHVNGTMQALLGPTVVTIPLAMFFSFILLKHRYPWLQVGSVFIILGGVVIAMIPTFQGGTGNIYWDLLYLFASVPLALMAVYEEKVFAQHQVHIAFMLACSTSYQAIFIFASFPVNFIPWFAGPNPPSFTEFFTTQKLALQCFMGHDIPVEVCGAGCDCQHAYIYIMLFATAYILCNFTLLGVVKYGNAAFSFIVSTLVVPLAEFAFASKFIMGDSVSPLTKYNYISLVLLIAGVLIYRYFDAKRVLANHKLATVGLDDETADYIISVTPSYNTSQPSIRITKLPPTLQDPILQQSHWTFP